MATRNPPRRLPRTKRDASGLIRCRVCGCTEVDACNPPCGWASQDKRGDLCTTCNTAAVALIEWMKAVRRVNLSGLFREVHARISR